MTGNLEITSAQRLQLESVVQDYIQRNTLTAPLSMDELRRHSKTIISESPIDPTCEALLAILINNLAWKAVVAAVPYEKRLLLLPQCLRNREKCKAEFDELGLICAHCGECLIGDIQTQAEQLGYAVLVAEGSPIVMSLIESGKIEAVIGVSCIAVLERTFPYMEAGAIPGIAIPLSYDGCINTTVDIDWITESLYLHSNDHAGRIDLNDIKSTVAEWFSESEIEEIFGKPQSKTEQIALDWLCSEGKRWRPFLTASAYYAIKDSSDDDKIINTLRNASVAVECFHKASLVHDDIEDDDNRRYGQKTVHAEHGVPVALNVGDFLLGEGYRLIADLPVNAERKAAMLKVAAYGHRDLCLGQGCELVWMSAQSPLTIDQVLDIFRKKTSPAFMVALKIGAILAGASKKQLDVLDTFSVALGVAFQIQDDLDDTASHTETKTPSLLAAIKHESERSCDSVKTALQMMEDFKGQALTTLGQLENPTLKSFLRRVLCKIFGDIETLRCCDDYTAEHNTSSSQSQKNAG